ncbi:DUF4188 domain-containing protein [Paenibacillus sp. MER TA 81-3]|uniref:DUF4188 domain-containing protein n=1 Tax=Paenibacillus sp. MER TA 81-3 TaxID=2939573 RepID=UPI00203CC2F2|nr:DUF4188 domain-containing protein [Paenibacillus sp. MER TA 81-3]MCM3337985.1 DUF4188 domain-containing protein [Paenibacillus sp. MER TA 81-3]
MKVKLGRYAAQMDGPFVVFIIGMRINRLFAFRKWVPVFRAMPRMMKELYQDKEHGFLHAEYYIGRNGPMLIQYWRSFEDLERYAKQGFHKETWRQFHKSYKDGSVGVYHETYRVEPGHYEAVYNHMPPTGLGKAGELIPAEGAHDRARGRMNA